LRLAIATAVLPVATGANWRHLPKIRGFTASLVRPSLGRKNWRGVSI
jgi:hypothetical protein